MSQKLNVTQVIFRNFVFSLSLFTLKQACTDFIHIQLFDAKLYNS